MAYVISDDCIACGACAAGCPVDAISEGDGKYVIDADACVSCGACAGTCPWVFRMGADGLAEAYREIEKTELDAAQDAAQDCPVGAIKIE